MVYLCGAVCCVQGDIVQAAIDCFIQLTVSKKTHPEFADMTFGPR
ncbi:hypothetical protein BV325_05107 [Pseudomonas syringae pv. actinidiae]|nr:hypothetical protein BV325_05107 [Pseudomonas syringae pv. actinidiae]OSR67913.1 hypothetical protein BV328_05084 [Pseudomonas syringae pv. actinidiae]RMS13257.1 hypothetical protein ALP75_205211 [Pseudomonas syringae pv. actinidiae]